MELVFESTNLGKILKDVSDIIYVRAHEAKLQYVVEVSPDIRDWLVTDGAKLKQVLINLLANAVKFTEAGTVRLDVKTRGKNFIEFLVIDSGIGISEEEQSFIFDPFKQAERGSGKGGTGLGLSISKQLAEKLGGRLGLSSEFGKGSTFTLLLPLKLPEEGIKIQPLSGSEEISVQELNNFTQMKIQFDTMVMERKQVEGARVSYKISHSDYQAMLDAMQIMNVTSMKKICIKMNEDPNFAESGKKMIDFVESFAFDELRGFLESLEKV